MLLSLLEEREKKINRMDERYNFTVKIKNDSLEIILINKEMNSIFIPSNYMFRYFISRKKNNVSRPIYFISFTLIE